MRLKPSGIVIILLIIVALAYYALKPKFFGTSQPTTSIEQTTPRTSPESSDSWAPAGSPKKTTTSEETQKKPEAREFNYTPEKPENGTLKGVVEMGATGFNSFVINMDVKKRWEIVSKDFGESLAYEGLASTEDIRAGLKKYIGNMFDKGVGKNNIHFVVSSGAQKEPKTTLIGNELKKMGYVVNNVTADQEAKLALKSVLPPSFSDNSFVVDIGSGNTKVSWVEKGTLQTIELPGAKYYEKGTSDEEVYKQVKDAVSKVPDDKRNVAFIVGGVPYTLAKQIRKGEERYTVLNSADAYKATDKKMTSGLNIYKAISDATKTDTFVFDWDANFTIGFLLNLGK